MNDPMDDGRMLVVKFPFGMGPIAGGTSAVNGRPVPLARERRKAETDSKTSAKAAHRALPHARTTSRRRLLLGVQEVPSSNLGSPTKFLKHLRERECAPNCGFWSPTGVQTRDSRRHTLRRLAAFFTAEFLRGSLLLKKPDKPDKSASMLLKA